MGQLEGRTAIVTGSARGLGEAIARRFVAEGANVVLSDRRADEGMQVVEELGDHARFVHADVTSEADWERTVDYATETWGSVDILVNNAGIIRVVPIAELDADTFRRVVDTNLLGTFLGTRAVLPTMTTQGRGVIVNLSSPQGFEGRAGMAAYASSKFAIRGFTKTAAIELGPLGIRVNTLVPGPMKTAMTRRKGWTDEDYDRAYERYPLGRMSNAHEVAAGAVFLASDEASFCTGSDLVIDGGITAGKPRD